MTKHITDFNKNINRSVVSRCNDWWVVRNSNLKSFKKLLDFCGLFSIENI